MRDVLSLCSSSSFRLQIVVDFDEIKEVLSLLMQQEKTPPWNLRWYVDVVKQKKRENSLLSVDFIGNALIVLLGPISSSISRFSYVVSQLVLHSCHFFACFLVVLHYTTPITILGVKYFALGSTCGRFPIIE